MTLVNNEILIREALTDEDEAEFWNRLGFASNGTYKWGEPVLIKESI